MTETNSPMQIVDWRWFNGGTGTVGIVRCQDPYDGTLYFIGAGMGQDETRDAQMIAGWGARFPNNAGDLIFQNTA